MHLRALPLRAKVHNVKVLDLRGVHPKVVADVSAGE